MRLCIAIPTYNRPEQLRRTITALIEQLTNDVYILVSDNNSVVPAEIVLQDIIAVNQNKIVIHKNSANIGSSANVTRLFELADAEWIWTLGDDDHPANNAVLKILLCIQNADPKLAYICFGAPTDNFGLLDYDNIINEIINEKILTYVFCISTGVYKLSELKKEIITGYYTSNSYFPFIAMMLKRIRFGSYAMFSKAAIMTYHHAKPGSSWPHEDVMLGISSLLEVNQLQTASFRKLVSKAIIVYRYRPFVSGSIKRIFLPSNKCAAYWVVFFRKISDSVTGIRKIQSYIFYLLSKIIFLLHFQNSNNLYISDKKY